MLASIRNRFSSSEPSDNKFGTFGGVFTPTILTILGAIMYLRLGWVVGNSGLIGAHDHHRAGRSDHHRHRPGRFLRRHQYARGRGWRICDYLAIARSRNRRQCRHPAVLCPIDISHALHFSICRRLAGNFPHPFDVHRRQSFPFLLSVASRTSAPNLLSAFNMSSWRSLRCHSSPFSSATFTAPQLQTPQLIGTI